MTGAVGRARADGRAEAARALSFHRVYHRLSPSTDCLPVSRQTKPDPPRPLVQLADEATLLAHAAF